MWHKVGNGRIFVSFSVFWIILLGCSVPGVSWFSIWLCETWFFNQVLVKFQKNIINETISFKVYFFMFRTSSSATTCISSLYNDEQLFSRWWVISSENKNLFGRWYRRIRLLCDILLLFLKPLTQFFLLDKNTLRDCSQSHYHLIHLADIHTFYFICFQVNDVLK